MWLIEHRVYNTEVELGLAIKESGVKREDLYCVTKVMKNVDNIELALDESLKKLQLEYVDLYLIHAPWFSHTESSATSPFDESKLQSTWATMEKIKASGKARSIGVSNYLPKHLEAVLKTAKIPPAINQIEFHPYLQHPELLAFHKKHSIATSAYGPLTAATKAKPGPADELLAALAKKYAVSEGEICLRWCLDQDVVAITTSAKEQRLADYLRCTKFKLTPEELRQLNQLGAEKHFRGFWGSTFDANDRT
ncbi:hypothetical protein, variant [Verruconis gallopava]|uniref:NADP-dependent oxidoreductase domain-containing protein n=1 Tax=Verruconis gallopava TaxID=253628 RepID=A0A0D1YGH8_9PEZI|nr:hypothetical protein, variant [Verruconis gallopava]KIV99901.1 hypothetical protein, variant [Verruconis gallopava]